MVIAEISKINWKEFHIVDISFESLSYTYIICESNPEKSEQNN